MRQMSDLREYFSQNSFFDRLIQYRISPCPKKAEKLGFRTGVTDGRTDGRTDGPTDGRTNPLIEMRGRI